MLDRTAYVGTGTFARSAKQSEARVTTGTAGRKLSQDADSPAIAPRMA